MKTLASKSIPLKKSEFDNLIKTLQTNFDIKEIPTVSNQSNQSFVFDIELAPEVKARILLFCKNSLDFGDEYKINAVFKISIDPAIAEDKMFLSSTYSYIEESLSEDDVNSVSGTAIMSENISFADGEISDSVYTLNLRVVFIPAAGSEIIAQFEKLFGAVKQIAGVQTNYTFR